MSVELSPKDLQVLFALVVTAEIKVGQVPSLWPAITNLEIASKSGVSFVAKVDEPPAAAEVNGNR